MPGLEIQISIGPVLFSMNLQPSCRHDMTASAKRGLRGEPGSGRRGMARLLGAFHKYLERRGRAAVVTCRRGHGVPGPGEETRETGSCSSSVRRTSSWWEGVLSTNKAPQVPVVQDSTTSTGRSFLKAASDSTWRGRGLAVAEGFPFTLSHSVANLR